MIRNVPSNYTRDLLMQEINGKFKNRYDFLNLPQENQQNAGYAFINLRDTATVTDFYHHFQGRSWEYHQTFKVALHPPQPLGLPAQVRQAPEQGQHPQDQGPAVPQQPHRAARPDPAVEVPRPGLTTCSSIHFNCSFI